MKTNKARQGTSPLPRQLNPSLTGVTPLAGSLGIAVALLAFATDASAQMPTGYKTPASAVSNLDFNTLSAGTTTGGTAYSYTWSDGAVWSGGNVPIDQATKTVSLEPRLSAGNWTITVDNTYTIGSLTARDFDGGSVFFTGAGKLIFDNGSNQSVLNINRYNTRFSILRPDLNVDLQLNSELDIRMGVARQNETAVGRIGKTISGSGKLILTLGHNDLTNASYFGLFKLGSGGANSYQGGTLVRFIGSIPYGAGHAIGSAAVLLNGLATGAFGTGDVELNSTGLSQSPVTVLTAGSGGLQVKCSANNVTASTAKLTQSGDGAGLVLLESTSQAIAGLVTTGSTAEQGRKRIASLTGAALTLSPQSSTTYSYGGVITGLASVTVNGSGTQVFTNSNLYSGGTTITNGTLLANNTTLTDSATGSNSVTVNGGVLGGTGSINGAVTVNSGASVNPGASAGTLTINNVLTLNTGASCTFELSADAVSGANDKLVLTGISTPGDPITVKIDASSLDLSNDYVLISWTDSSSPSFNSTPQYIGATPATTYTVVVDNGLKQVRLHPQVTTWPITVSAGANGSISPPGPTVSVNDHASQAFNIIPAPGYLVDDVVIDSTNHLGAATSYTFTDVTTAHTISATFISMPNQTINASVSGSGGIISDAGDTSVPARSDMTYTITPDPGYKVQDVVIDGTTHLGSVTSYTFTFVITNHTIVASFSVADSYWDTNAAAGLQPGPGTWQVGGGALWNPDAAGSGTPTTWQQGLQARFATGGANAVMLSGTISAYSLNVATNGTLLSISGGTLDTLELGAGGVTVAGDQDGHTIAAAVTLTADQAWTLGRNLAASGAIAGSGKLTKEGAGTLTLSVPNNYNGGTVVNAGTLTVSDTGTLGSGGTVLSAGTAKLNLNNADALGSGPLTLNGGTINNTSTGAVAISGSNSQNWNGDFTFTGTQDLNLGGGAVAMTGNRIVTASAKTLTVGGAITGTGTLTKAGAGTLVLTGTGSSVSTLGVSGGTLQIGPGGSLTSSGGGALNLTGTSTMVVTDATLTAPGADQAHDGVIAMAVFAGASTVNLTGEWLTGRNMGSGSLTIQDTAIVNGGANALRLGRDNIRDNSAVLKNQAQATFGSVIVFDTSFYGAGGQGSGSVLEVHDTASLTAGSMTVANYLGNNGTTHPRYGNGQVYQPGGTVTINGPISMGLSVPQVGDVLVGTYNLSGGVLNCQQINNGAEAIPGTANLNLHGGKLAYNGTGPQANLISLGASGKLYLYETTTIDDGGKDVTVNQALLTPNTGKGVASITLSTPIGAVGAYPVPPEVYISGADGSGATAIAVINSSRQVSAIVVTNPGVGYTGTPTVQLFYQGATATVPAGSITMTDNAYTGGLAKTGGGTLTLTAANTYSGGTSVEQGTLKVSNTIDSGTGPGNLTVKAGAALGGTGSVAGAVTVESDGKLLANITNWTGGTCDHLTVASLSLPASWAVTVAADISFTEENKTFQFLTATGGITGFTAPTVTGPGTGTWAVQQNPGDAKILEVVYTAGSGSPYATWAALHAGGQTPNLDYNNDGVSNGIAFFMGMDGLATNPGVENGTVTWPWVNPVTSYQVQVSDDLQTWEAATGVVAPASPPGNVVYTLPTGAAKKFCRLMVTP